MLNRGALASILLDLYPRGRSSTGFDEMNPLHRSPYCQYSGGNVLNFRRPGADLQMKFERTDGALIDRLHIDSYVLVGLKRQCLIG